MQPPFSEQAFFEVFVRYNQAIGAVPVVAWLLGAAAVALALRPAPWSGRAIAAILAAFWAWMGLAYHIGAFAALNPPAYGFGALFVIEAVLLAAYGVVGNRLSFRPRRDLVGVIAFAMIAYGLVVYGLLGMALGHAYPAAPLFGVAPCPTTVFTLGLLLLVAPRPPLALMAIPLAWSAIGTSAAVYLGVTEDIGLGVAAALAIAALVWQHRRPRSASAP